MPDSSQTNSTSNLFRPVQTKRASEAVFEQVRDLILQKKLKPGDRLPSERSMIDMFQRSRPTIREALRMLEREGYISIMAGSTGAVVLPPSNDRLAKSLTNALHFSQITLPELAEYRLVSEMNTVKWAAQRHTKEDLDAMEKLLQEMATEISNPNRFSEMDSTFHGLVAQAAQNRISSIFNRTFSKLNRSFLLNRTAAMSQAKHEAMCSLIHHQHIAIFEAIRDSDTERASAAMQEHLDAFLHELLEDAESTVTGKLE